MRRVVAVLGAVLMVGVALLIRGGIDGDDSSGGGGSDGGDGGDEVTLLCVDELEDVCDALVDAGAIDDFTSEAAGDTVDRLTEDDLGADGWLTLEPFPEMTDVGRDQVGRGAIFGDPMATGFSTQIDAVVHPGREEAFADACEEVEWPCLGDLAGDQWTDHGGQQGWGEIRIGMNSHDSASGLLVAAQAVAAHLAIDDFATNDLQESDADRWVGRFETGSDVLAQLVTRGAGAFSAVGALDVEAQDLAQTAQGADLAIFYPAPMFRAEVVLVAPGASADDLIDRDDLDDALAEAGWGEGGSSDLPSAGALYALRESL
jgi:hypothetical protein